MPGPAYRLVTSRLVLRCPDPADASHFKRAIDASHEALAAWMPWMHPTPDVAGLVATLRRFRAEFDTDVSYPYAVWSRDEAELWGSASLHLRVGPGATEIGYWIHSARTGQGLATELTAALTRIAFAVHGFSRVEIHVAPGNRASLRVPEKLGFTHEATLARRIVIPTAEGVDAVHDRSIWTMFAGEFAASPCAAAEVQAFDALGDRIL